MEKTEKSIWMRQIITGIQLSKKNALMIAIAITIGAMLVEFFYGERLKSTMLKSDALHMLSHSLALGISLFAILYGNSHTERRSKIEAISALINGVLLVGFVAYIIYESVVKMLGDLTLDTSMLIPVAVFGLIINLLTALILNIGGVEDLNTRGAYLHLLADTFSSVAIIIGAILAQQLDWYWVDPVMSLIIAAIVAKWSYGLFRDALKQLRAEKD